MIGDERESNVRRGTLGRHIVNDGGVVPIRPLEPPCAVRLKIAESSYRRQRSSGSHEKLIFAKAAEVSLKFAKRNRFSRSLYVLIIDVA